MFLRIFWGTPRIEPGADLFSAVFFSLPRCNASALNGLDKRHSELGCHVSSLCRHCDVIVSLIRCQFLKMQEENCSIGDATDFSFKMVTAEAANNDNDDDHDKDDHDDNPDDDQDNDHDNDNDNLKIKLGIDVAVVSDV